MQRNTLHCCAKRWDRESPKKISPRWSINWRSGTMKYWMRSGNYLNHRKNKRCGKVLNQTFPHLLYKNRSDVIRTRDLYVPNVALYQTEPHFDVLYYSTSFSKKKQAVIWILWNYFPEKINKFFTLCPHTVHRTWIYYNHQKDNCFRTISFWLIFFITSIHENGFSPFFMIRILRKAAHHGFF